MFCVLSPFILAQVFAYIFPTAVFNHDLSISFHFTRVAFFCSLNYLNKFVISVSSKIALKRY